jgi:polyhydroxyalkanoate synthesis regulator phasin
MKLQLDKAVFTEKELKGILTEIKSGEKAWKDVNQILTIKSMITHIGSIDFELRDKLIYTSFFRLIIEDNQLESELLTELLDISLNDLLLKGIGENGTDTVFTRAFTTLLIALILYRDNEDSFLGQRSVDGVKDQLIMYINNEKDLRGFVSGKGWAHSVAHVADAVDELVKNPKISHEHYPVILQSLWKKMFVSDSVYIHDEDERMITPIIQLLNNGLDVQEIKRLVDNITTELKTQKEQLDEEKYWFLVFNSKTFLKSFYLKISGDPKFDSIRKSIEQCLAEI